MREMGGLCPKEKKKVNPETPGLQPEPSYDYIVRGNFIPQQNGDLKVREEQGSPDFTSRNS